MTAEAVSSKPSTEMEWGGSSKRNGSNGINASGPAAGFVVFDEYHFGAWRETAKELFEGEEEAIAKKEAKLEYGRGLEDVNEDLSELSEKEIEFLPITTKAYLYLSGTPFRALATGEFIEEQIFNWTYTDEQRAKEKFE